MTLQEHQEFIAEVVSRNKIDFLIPSAPDKEVADFAVKCMSSRRPPLRLLGMCLSGWICDDGFIREEFALVNYLALALTNHLRKNLKTGRDDLVMTSLWVRSALFWHYLRTGHRDPSLINSGADLLSACIAVRPSALKESEFVLTQNYGANTIRGPLPS
jgi:hypothetical protein